MAFYGFWRPEFLSVMLLSAVNDYALSLLIYNTDSKSRKKFLLYISLIVNLGLLFYFKYLLFFIDNFSVVLNVFGVPFESPALNIILPLGISFYTFQTISYTVDVYRGFLKPEKDFILYGTFVMFFPQLVAGPILRAVELIDQLRERPPFYLNDMLEGCKRILYGLFLKVVLADNIAPFVDEGFEMAISSLGALDVFTLSFLLGFQIYFDFSAYSHIAIGSAKLLGITFPENFNFPYAATSFKDFWKRWHISLSSWIRDYLYLPIIGAKVMDKSTGGLDVSQTQIKKFNKDYALFITWAIMGLWHGSSWTYVLWGIYHACVIFLERKLKPLRLKYRFYDKWLSWFIVLPVAMLSWIPFRADDLTQTFQMFAKLLQPTQYLFLGMRENTYIVTALVLLLFCTAYFSQTYLAETLNRKPVLKHAISTIHFAVLIILVFTFLRPINQFIYFQF
ncbi:MBOAT family O-acyltransferase [Pontibacter fetidus]|nr:MBOAT family protein [Pontibacter fetidus]